MNHANALPLLQQIGLDLVGPPVLTFLWWLMSRGWANIAQSGRPTTGTKIWMNKGAWILLGILYCLAFGITIYGYWSN